MNKTLAERTSRSMFKNTIKIKRPKYSSTDQGQPGGYQGQGQGQPQGQGW